MPQAPADVMAHTAAELTVRWANLAHAQGTGAGGAFPARPEPVERSAMSAALLVCCRACTLSLSAANLTTTAGTAASPLTSAVQAVEPVVVADGLAVAAVTLATQVAWGREARWAVDPVEVDEDVGSIQLCMAAARAPVRGHSEAPASARSPPDDTDLAGDVGVIRTLVRLNPSRWPRWRAPEQERTR